MVFSRYVVATAVSALALGSAACVAPTDVAEMSPLVGTEWELRQIQMNDGQLLTAQPPQNYTAEFSDDGEVFVQADCNRAIGQYTVEDDNRLSITMGPTTLAACPEGSIGTEFLEALNNSALYFFQGDDLFIDMQFDSGTIQFSGTPTPPLVGTVWQMQQIQMADDTLIVADSPENYTVELMDDGELLVQADCNQGRGSYTLGPDRRLDVGEIATTRMACPEGSVDNEFVQALSSSDLYFFQDGDLFIDLRFGSGTMQMSAQ
ncbi:META domain-containing protein [Nodosilinea sp. P-1105]|uniref:META domain-containing protein n=1 Tax=Nodosilinea sp. P-1105 TaxID=2546229 RepID=UPI00146AA107|nr:META domain-containing protein [Nodosilinea sp. P-1105]NMF83277.1 META domain-containing protein [Nodosilinea sp. P-1105]